MLRIEIETGNAAFVDSPEGELAELLERVRGAAGPLAAAGADGTGIIRDTNGATVGRWELTAE